MCRRDLCGFGGVKLCCVWERFLGLWGVSLCFLWDSLVWVCASVFVLCVLMFEWIFGASLCYVCVKFWRGFGVVGENLLCVA